nr:hypothetical protein [Tanacetum cinerariifolium]
MFMIILSTYSRTLYNKSCGCSKGGFIDKFVRDPDKTPDSSQRPPHDCPKCGNPDENSFTYDSNLSFVDDSPNPPPQPPTYSYEFCGNNAHYGHDCPPQVPFIYNPKPCYSQDFNFPQNIQSYNNMFVVPVVGAHMRLSMSTKPSQCQKIPIYYDDDDDEESSTPLRDIIIFELLPCIAITPVLSTEKPKDSLIIRDEHLDTIPEKESDKFIKSSVKNLVPNPSESEDLSSFGSEYGVPICDDFTTFSNLLFDADDNFSSSDDKSFSDEDVPKEIYSNPLFDEEIISIKIDPHHFNAESDLIESLLNQDSSIISSSKIDYFLDEFVDELIFLKSIPPGIDKADCDPEEEIRLIEKLLYDNSSPRPPGEPNSKNSDAIIESFSPSPIPVEDNIENDDYDSEGDILFLEEFLSNDSLSLPENESFDLDVPSSPRPPAKPPDDDEIEPDTRILAVKVVGDIYEHYVLMPRLLPTQPTLALNEEKPPHLLSHRGFKAF